AIGVKQTLLLAPSDEVVLFSSETKKGKDEAWNAILAKINN
ncbi:YihA family ribosome biogenesis GTP-binding protein, partial [Bacillus pumilus]|nr:YihA family ribosome biogenesis GTP-binding protein [Bacillus pumilus]